MAGPHLARITCAPATVEDEPMSVSDQSSDVSALNVREHIARIDQILTQRIRDHGQRDHAQIDPPVWACAPPWPFVVTSMVLGAAIFAAGMYVGAAIVRHGFGRQYRTDHTTLRVDMPLVGAGAWGPDAT